MQTAAAHYDSHLGPVYSWMLGDMEAALARAASELDEMQLPACRNGLAVDLGAGLGLHALQLADRGFLVTAIDNCQRLLDEWQSRRSGVSIEVVKGDLLNFRVWVKGQAQVITCLGDTLTHLSTHSAVESLLADVAVCLAPQGLFAATFRDYAGETLEGDKRFILVRADEHRILTCFLEYAAQAVTVHDLLNVRDHGQWRQEVSSYPKLRLAPAWVTAKLIEHGLTVRSESLASGMVRILARRLG